MLTTHQPEKTDKVVVDTLGTGDSRFYIIRIGDMKIYSEGYAEVSDLWIDNLILELQHARGTIVEFLSDTTDSIDMSESESNETLTQIQES